MSGGYGFFKWACESEGAPFRYEHTPEWLLRLEGELRGSDFPLPVYRGVFICILIFVANFNPDEGVLDLTDGSFYEESEMKPEPAHRILEAYATYGGLTKLDENRWQVNNWERDHKPSQVLIDLVQHVDL